MIYQVKSFLLNSNTLTNKIQPYLYNALKYVLETPDVIREWREILNHTKIRFTQQARSEKLFDIIDKALK